MRRRTNTRHRDHRRVAGLLAWMAGGLLALTITSGAKDTEEKSASDFARLRGKLAEIELTDQDGRQVRIYEDLMKDRVVALSFVFTDCPGICPPIGANVGKVQKLLGEKLGKEIGLVTVTVDPRTDTPEEMKKWGDKFGARAGWSLLTDKSGRRDAIDGILKALKIYTTEFEDHSPFILLVDDRNSRIERVHGIASKPAQISAKLLAMAARADSPPKTEEAPDPSASAAQRYFTDIALVDQDGEARKFYTDLIKGRIVVIGSFFATCKGVCPVMMSTLEKMQASLGDRMGKDVRFISISVDPLLDTPQEMKRFAERFNAQPGWFFLSGEKDEVETVLHKLGFAAEAKESHSNVLIMGNEPTGLWKKARGLSSAESLAEVLKSVMDDKG